MELIRGDRVVVESERATGSPRRGVIEEILSRDPLRYSIRWADGRVSILRPNAGVARIERRLRQHIDPAGTGSLDEGGESMSQLQTEDRSRATVERWDPAREIDQMTERMRRMLEQTFGGFGFAPRGAEQAGWVPVADVEEQDDSYVVQLELPGVKPEDVTIELVGNELSVTGEVKEEQRKGLVRKRMRRYGRFEHRLHLPSQLDADKVDAKLTNGVLTVHVPKSEKAKRKQITVKSG
jgi:HSP20 family protein